MQPKIESPNLSNLLLSHFQNTSEMIYLSTVKVKSYL